MNLFRLLLSYPLHRATVAGLSFGAAIIGARFLPADLFSALITAAFLAKFLQILNLGATAGYFIGRYSGQGLLAHCDPRAERRYFAYFLGQLGGLGLVVVTVTLIWFPEYRTGGIAFLLLAPLFAIEAALRYRRNFSFSLAPEFLLTLGLMSAVVAYLAGVAEHLVLMVYLLAIAVVGMLVLGISIFPHISELRGGDDQFALRDYAQAVMSGGPVFLGSALFLVSSSMDRLLLPLYGADEQIAIYFLAYQLALGSMIFVTAINFVNTVNLGQARQDEVYVDSGMVAKKMHSAALVALSSFLVLIAGSFVLEEWFLPDNFEGLTFVVLILGAGFALFFISNAITPIVAYFHRQIPLTIAMGCAALVLAANNAWVYWSGLDIVWLAVGTAVALSAYAIFAIWLTFLVLRQQIHLEIAEGI